MSEILDPTDSPASLVIIWQYLAFFVRCIIFGLGTAGSALVRDLDCTCRRISRELSVLLPGFSR